MEKFQPSQLAKLVMILLLLITPFVSTSMRTSYLYFLFNFLIILLGVEAGFLTAISPSHDERKTIAIVAPVALEPHPHPQTITDTVEASKGVVEPEKAPIVEKPVVAKIVARVNKLKRVPSMPSLFFIGSCEEEGEFDAEDVVEFEELGGDLSAQELFAKAEMFIGNFYNQLKMQREESWKKIHGLYQKAF